MELLIYNKTINSSDAIDNFMNFYHSINMNYLASDLLDKGLSPQNISDAVAKAIKIATSSGINVRAHFMPVFTGVNQSIISDCKLSKLGYGLVLLNADSKFSVVGKWQLTVLEKFLN